MKNWDAVSVEMTANSVILSAKNGCCELHLKNNNYDSLDDFRDKDPEAFKWAVIDKASVDLCVFYLDLEPIDLFFDDEIWDDFKSAWSLIHGN